MQNIFFILQGEAEYVNYWKYVELNPEEYKLPNIESAIKELSKDSRTLYVSQLFQIYAFYKRRLDMPGLRVIKDSSTNSYNLIFPKFSPLTPLFRKFALVSLENELFAKLTHRWFGDGVPPPETARTVVSFSHVLPAFLIIGFIMTVSLGILAIEKLWKSR